MAGPIRGPTVDKKTQVSISKRLQVNYTPHTAAINDLVSPQQRLQKTQVYGGRSTVRGITSGIASSVAFTPLQGLEIVNPMAAEKKVQEVINSNIKIYERCTIVVYGSVTVSILLGSVSIVSVY